jgi:predicted Zn finger-like uncharacterized protein
MIVTCDHCGAKYNLDPTKVQGRGARITCPKCAHVFTVYKENADAGSESNASVEEPAPSTELDVYNLNFKSVGIRSWKVKVKIGLVYDFSDYKTLEKYIRDGRVSGTDLLSYDGQNWVSINDAGDLKAYFVGVYQTCQATPLESGQESKATQPSNASVNIDDEKMDDLNALMAEAQAEVTGEVPKKSNSVKSRKSSKRRKSSKKKVVNDNWDGPKERNPLLLIIVGILVIVGGVYAYSQFNPPPEVVLQKPEINQTVEDPGRSEALRAEIQHEIEMNAQQIKQELPEEASTNNAETEPEWIPVVPEEVLLAQQNGNTNSPSTQPSSNPSSASELAQEGKRRAESNDWTGASQYYQQAVDKEPSNRTYLEGLGEALYRSGQNQSAKETLLTALNLGSVVANKWLGFITKDDGDIAGANKYFTKYLESNPSDASQIEQVMRGG